MTHSSQKRTAGLRHVAMLALSGLTPLLMGGCPELQNELVGVVATATRGALFSDDDIFTISDTARAGLIDASLNFVFSQLEANPTR